MDSIPLSRYAFPPFTFSLDAYVMLTARTGESSYQSHDEWFELFLVQSHVTRFEEKVSRFSHSLGIG